MAFIAAIEQMATQLRDLQAPVSEVQVMAKIIMSLPQNYRHFISAWDSVPAAEKTITLLTSRLLKEEKMTKIYSQGGGEQSETAYYSGNGRRRVAQANPGPSRPHLPHSSYLDRGQKPSYSNARSNHRGSTGGYRSGGNNGRSSWVVCHYCGFPGHMASNCRKRLREEKGRQNNYQSDSQDFGYSSSISFTRRRNFDWFADSGATQHMTDQLEVLANFVSIPPETWSVTGIGDIRLKVCGKGDVVVTSSVNGETLNGTIRGVLYVPGLGANLFSIGAATNSGSEVHFVNETVSFTRNGRIEIQGQRVGNTLYHLNIRAQGVPNVTDALRAQKHEPLHLWHQRLAHLNHKTIVKMASQGSVVGLENLKVEDEDHQALCKGCVFGKMHRFPFKRGRNRASVVGELVHMDLCGPMEVSTPGGARYFAIFKDDFSGWCITKPLKKKSQTFEFIQECVARLVNETGHKVKTLRSDNGGEFLSTDLGSWFATTGIRHECSVPYTPQHNGVAERTNR